MHGEKFAYTKDPKLVFLQQLTFTVTLQRSTLVVLFTSHYFSLFFLLTFVVIYDHIPVTGLWFLMLSVFVGFAHRESCLMLMSF